METVVSAEPLFVWGIDSGATWAAIGEVFRSLGDVFLCLDDGFRVVHASSVLDDLLGRGASAGAVGRPVEDVLGAALFGAGAPLRQALAAGDGRSSARAELPGPGGAGPRRVAVTAAPILPAKGSWDPRVSYVAVLRPTGETEPQAGGPAQRLTEILEKHRWRRVDAARALGVSRTTLWRMMREAGLSG
jgi:hypothetical protein